MPYYWLGPSFEGLPLTHVDGDRFGSVTVYGTCDPGRGSEQRCAPPIQAQARRCRGGTVVKVAVFDGRGKRPRAFRAAGQVRPLNRAAREADWGYASVDYMPYCAV